MKKNLMYLVGLFVVLVCSAFTYQHTAAAPTKDDITGIALEKEMRELIQLGVIHGYSEGEYRPHEEITRGQFAAFVARALELPEGEPAFTDVPASSNLAKDIYRAASAGIVNGYGDKTFRMNQLVTREQMAAMIDNALIFKQMERKGAVLNFTDAEQINPSFRDAVVHNVNDGIISGFKNEDNTYSFNPKMEANRAQAAAFIARMLHILEPVPEPEPEPVTGYSVASINANKELVPGTVSYASFDEAKKAVTNANQVVTNDGKIVSMSGGLVISEQVATIYEKADFKTSMTYVNAQQEMEYIDSSESYVKVNIAGKTGYVKPAEVSLLPDQMIAGRSYYSVVNGDLIHYVYSQKTKTAPNYVAGKAPSFLTAGQKYYSWDGAAFYNEAGQHAGTAYQYFTYLPARTVTNYSAEELDDFIEYMLKDRETLYNSDPVKYVRYQDVVNKSKLKGLGAYLKEAEGKYHINALFMLAISFNESDYGMSEIAQTKNNLFGLKAYDSNLDAAATFEAPTQSIDGLATEYLNGKYLDISRSFYANGSVFGNKAVGINVRYASDPYWGQKNAGYMYRADKYLGRKDYGKYQLGLTNTTDLNVRSQATSSSQKYYTYPKSGMPVAIIGTEVNPADGATWYKVVSEHIDYPEGYIHGAYVTPINVAQ
ncbi:S-layer homology domain-containing protein [Bacillus benzoevorans]|uniref:Beta-N-acetylglucosaminidase n=1 Tax=Bacillus benzoevorans TaxID=1456 RepID=A0A7X0HSF4_9BACI|nr:S-layer homology domain-containing protein [Bacillus benzoevorans]MBB6446032.1 beta-N-acetylglucosaminidase [Bacillus benzoevorans]